MEEITAERITRALITVVNSSYDTTKCEDVSDKIELLLELLTADMPLHVFVTKTYV